jgi:hypothetical protein
VYEKNKRIAKKAKARDELYKQLGKIVVDIIGCQPEEVRELAAKREKLLELLNVKKS